MAENYSTMESAECQTVPAKKKDHTAKKIYGVLQATPSLNKTQ